MENNTYKLQVELLLKILPIIAREKVFALKGGTALNLFLWNMPRLSVDIDLTFLPILERDETFEEIGLAVARMKKGIEEAISGVKVISHQVPGTKAPTTFSVEVRDVKIKVEINFVLRGSLFPVTEEDLCERAQEEFNVFVSIQRLSVADLYGGKICAALDRQHPRDLYDVMNLFRNQGITDEIRKAFVVYLASHSRPMNELLSPTWRDISELYEINFRGMTHEEVVLSDLLDARGLLLATIKSQLLPEEKQFLLSVKKGEPEWDLLGIPGLEKLPGIRWKLLNIRKMSDEKREMAYERLEAALS